LVAGVELKPRTGAPGARAAEVFQKCYEQGVLLRYTSDIIAISPPLIINEEQIEHIFNVLGNVLKQVD